MIRRRALRARGPLTLVVASALAGGCQLIAGLDDTGPAHTSSSGGAGGTSGSAGGTGGTPNGAVVSSSSSGGANGGGGGAPCASPPGTIVAAAAGSQHSCAIVHEPNGNTVHCWGDNSNFQLGLSGAGAGGPQPTIVTQISFSPTMIAAGDVFTCASAGDHNVTCWGNAFGIAMDSAALSQTFVADVKSLTAGAALACALLVNKDLWCWGYVPELMTTADATQVAVDVQAAAVGGDHVCYAVNDEVACLGENNHDECGEAASTSMYLTVATDVTGGSEVFAGEEHTCARDASSALVCWGSDTDGEVDGIPGADRPGASMTPGMDHFGHAALGDRHTCTTDGTELDCWGSNQSDQIGSVQGQYQARHKIPPGFGFQGITAGGDHTCIWSKTEVQCWGRNDFGECGRFGSAPYDPTGAMRVCW